MKRNKIIKGMACLVVALTLTPIATAQGNIQAGGADRQRAVVLWEEAIRAKGGRERLRQIESLYIERAQPEGDRDYYFYAFPGSWFNYTYGGRRRDVAQTVHNGRLGITWWLPPSGEPARERKSSTDDRSSALVAQFTYLMITRWLEPRPLSSRREWLGFRRVDVVEVDADGWHVTYFLDPKTHLPVQLIAPEGEIPRARGERHKVVRFEDYVAIDGTMMPRRVTHSYTSIHRRWSEKVVYEINPRHDPRFFEQPPTTSGTPQSWRVNGEMIRKPQAQTSEGGDGEKIFKSCGSRFESSVMPRG